MSARGQPKAAPVASTSPVDALDALFADPAGTIAELASAMPDPAPDAVVRVSRLLSGLSR